MINGKIVFFGTSNICIPYLVKINAVHNIQLIITQPDTLGGRNKQKIIPPVKRFALDHNIPVLQPPTLKDRNLKIRLTSMQPDLGVVISYGKIIPPSVYQIPQHNTINLHFSLLPRYRGAAPVQRAILQGESVSGITIFELSRKMDCGRIIAQKEIPISPQDTSRVLFEKMGHNSRDFLMDIIDKILQNNIKKVPQDHSRATYAGPIKKAEGRINWQNRAGEIFNQFRAFSFWPGTYFFIKDKQFKITSSKVSPLSHAENPGKVFSLDQQSLKVCCGRNSVLEINQFQPQNKKVMTPYSYSLGNKIPDYLN